MLLRVLQERELEYVGGSGSHTVHECARHRTRRVAGRPTRPIPSIVSVRYVAGMGVSHFMTSLST